MKKKLIPLLALIPVVMLFLQRSPVEVVEERVVSLPPKFKPLPLSPEKASLSREPAREVPEQRAALDLPVEKKKRRAHPDWESILDLDRGLKVLRDVYAVKTENYSPALGEAITETGEFTFVNSAARPEGASPVAYDRANGRYWPVSSIVKVEGVNREMRDDLIQNGLTEYYYAKNLSVLYVESTPDKVIDLYRELKKQKLSAELEVLRPARIAK